MRNVDRKEAKSAAWMMEAVSCVVYCSDCSGRAYEDENDVEEILPLALALTVFDASVFKVVFPSRFLLVNQIWKRSDRFAVAQANLLGGASSIGKSELASEIGILLY